jgi:DNA replication protein DnaC
MEQARIPQRYVHCELDNFDLVRSNQHITAAKVVAEKFVDEYPMSPPFGLLFMGPQGVGKTHLAVGILKQLVRDKSAVGIFRAFPELLKDIQNSWNPVSQASELSLLAPVLDAEVLVLDELGAQTPTSWVRDTLAYILNHRYNENRVTLLTTNYFDEPKGTPGRRVSADTYSLVDRIGPPLRSRLFEMCKTQVMKGADFREEVKQAQHHF